MEKWKNNLILLLFVWMGLAGSMLAVTNGFQFEFNKNSVVLTVFFVSTVVTVLLTAEKKTGTYFAVGTAAGSIGFLFLIRGARVWESIGYMRQCVLEELETYLGISLGADYAATGSDASEGMIFVFILVGLLLAFGTVRMKRAWLVLILLGISILLPFLVGEIVGNTESVLCLLAMAGVLATKTGTQSLGRTSVGMTGMLLAAAALLFGNILAASGAGALFQEKKQPAELASLFKEQSKVLLGGAKGGVGNGKVGNAGEFLQEDTGQLIVRTTQKPPGKIYLQGYIGSEYKNNRWNLPNERQFQKMQQEKDESAAAIKNRLYERLGMFLEEDVLQIENIGANQKYKYVPYGSFFEESDSIVADAYVEGREKSYEVSYYPANMEQLLQIYQDGDGDDEVYDSYVKEENLTVPEQIREAFAEEVDTKISDSTPYQMVQEIAAVLKKQAVYSLKPGRTPSGRDVAEYFYFENRKGYCEHFATTAALMLRMKGIPARYVAGYAVDEDDFYQNAEGMYEAVVTGESAHAWAEVYIEGVGWLPAETTPGYSDIQSSVQGNIEDTNPQPEPDMEDSNPQPEPSTNLENESEQEPESEDGEEAGNMASEPKKEAKNHSLPLHAGQLGIVLACSICVVILMIIVWNVRVVNRRRNWKKKNAGKRVRDGFYEMFELLVLAKIVEKEEPLGDTFLEKLCTACPDIKHMQARQLFDTVYKVNFGNEKMQKEEYQNCINIYRAVQKSVFPKLSFWKKIRYLYGRKM